MSVPWADERFWVSILANVAGLTRQEAVVGLQELVDAGLLTQERKGGLVRYVAGKEGADADPLRLVRTGVR